MVKVLTWNMQGGNDEKWGTAKSFLKDYDVICLQECGTPPSYLKSAMAQSTFDANCSYLRGHSEKIARNKVSIDIVYHKWETEKDGKEKSNPRCSLAILSKSSFDAIHQILPTTHKETRRPVIGIRLEREKVWAYCIHAPSGRPTAAGNYTREMLATIPNDRSWFCAGDFNCDPRIMGAFLRRLNGVRVDSTGKATQQNGGELDYVVVRGGVAWNMELIGKDSDHYPVSMDLTFGL
jgi:endonuclease/exonuclease/phosphatase family metal-dependent hydrolase